MLAAGQATPWCPVLPEDSTRHVPFRGTRGPPDLPSVRRTERTPKGGSAMATVKTVKEASGMAAKWIELVTGSLEQKKQYRQDKARIEALPEPYGTAAK